MKEKLDSKRKVQNMAPKRKEKCKPAVELSKFSEFNKTLKAHIPKAVDMKPKTKKLEKSPIMRSQKTNENAARTTAIHVSQKHGDCLRK